MTDVLVWNKYSRIIMQLAERLKISPVKALHLFYNSKYIPFYSIKNIL